MPPVKPDPYAATAERDFDPYAATAEPSSKNAPYKTTEESEHARLLKQGKVPNWRQTVRTGLNALPTVGGIGGSIAGAGLGAETGPGAFATGALGAAAGGALGEAFREEGYKRILPNEYKAMTGTEVAKAMAMQGGAQAAQDVTGRLGALALRPVFNRFSQAALKSEVTGIPLLPSEAAGKPSGTIENYMRGSFWTSGKMAKFRAMQNAQTDAAVQKIANTISDFRGTPEQLGQKVLDGVEQHTKEFRAAQNKMYNDIDELVAEKTIQVPRQVEKQSTMVGPDGKPLTYTETEMQTKLEGPAMPSTAGLKQFAQEQLDKIEAQEQLLDPNLLSGSKAMLQTIVDGPDKVTFSVMKDTRSDLLAVVRRLDEALPGKMAGQAKKLAGLADEAMMDAAEKSGIEDLPKMVREANAFTADEHKTMERKLVKSILDSKKPVEGIASVIRGGAGAKRYSIGLAETRDVFKILPPNLHGPVQRQVILDTLAESTDSISGMFNEGKFARIIGKMGDGRGEIIFGENWKNIKEFSKLLEQINGPVGRKGGALGAASLANPETMKDIASLLLPFSQAAHGNVGKTGLYLGYEFVGYNTVVYALTHPATAAKLVKVLQIAAQGAAYGPGLAYNLTGGRQSAQKLKDLREKAQRFVESNKPKSPAIPGPQSMAKPYTHVFNEKTGIIEAA